MYTATRFVWQRLSMLDQAIRAGELPNAVTMARKLEVSRRTIQRDIEFLRDRLKAPLAYDPRLNGYAYTDPDYQLPLLSLTEGELIALFLAERVLQHYRGTPYGPDLERAFAKITAGLTEQVKVDLGDLGALHSFRTTASAPFEPAIFRDLAAAARQRRRVVLDYWTASRDEENRREVDPYHLASVDGQWYLVGYCHLRAAVKMFLPGRIRALETTGATFRIPDDFRIEHYLRDAFGVLRGDETQKVRLRFRGEAVRYVRERMWHPSQTLESDTEDGLIIGLTVSHLREVERWALSWGADCEVLEPVELRDRMAATLDDASSLYTPSPEAS